MPVRVPRRESAARLACLAWISVALATAAASGAEGPRGADWASKDALVYVEVGRPGALLDRVLAPKFQAYLGSIPPYARFLKSDRLREAKAHVAFLSGLLETTWDDGLRKLAGGGIVVAVEAEAGKAPWEFVAVTPSDPAFLARAHAKLVEIARADARAKGLPDPVNESVHRGVTLFSTTKDESHAIVRETLVIAKSADAVRTVVDRALGAPVASIATDPDWKARKARASADTMAWGIARLDRLRALDPKAYTIPPTTDPGPILLFGPWIEALRKAPWAAAEVAWSDAHLSAEVALPTPAGGYPEPLRRFLPPKGQGAPALLKPRGTIASLGLWRDLSSIWEVRTDLFPPQVVQGLAQLDTFAGQFFGGRDFGSGVLGALGKDWRLVVAEQDYATIRPVPDLKLPAFALVVDLKPDDEDFAQRLKVAFQSFVGLANLGAAQSKAPQLELISEAVDGVAIASTRFMQPKAAPDPKEPVHQRQNYSPSAAQVGNHFILSSSLGLTKDLIPALRAPAKAADPTLVVEADGPALARVLDANRRRLITQNMMEKGNDQAAASGEIDTLLGFFRYIGRGTLTARDGDKAVEFRLDFALGAR